MTTVVKTTTNHYFLKSVKHHNVKTA